MYITLAIIYLLFHQQTMLEQGIVYSKGGKYQQEEILVSSHPKTLK